MLKRRHLLAAVLLAPLGAERAVALEYCVTCEGPPSMYRCVIDGTSDGPGKDPSASLYCISQMAKRGGHQQCAVARGAPFPCPGLTATVEPPKNLPTKGPAPASDTPADHAAPAEPAADPAAGVEATEAPEAPAPSPPAKVPRTVEELAGQTMKSSKEGLEKAGQAIGGTAKKAGEQIGTAGSAIGNAASKTWTCITSLFSSCGDEPPAAAPEPTPGDGPATD